VVADIVADVSACECVSELVEAEPVEAKVVDAPVDLATGVVDNGEDGEAD
jgi:hypothetical protein